MDGGMPGAEAPSGRGLRHLLVALAVLVGAVVFAACGDDDGTAKSGGSDLGDSVVFADYGGVTRDVRDSVFASPFENKTGVSTTFADADPAKLELFAKRGRADWDLIELDGFDIYRFGQQGLLQELPKTVTRGDLVPEGVVPYATGGYVLSDGIGYNTTAGPAPKSWSDFFNTTDFPGKRGIFTAFPSMVLEGALLADGVRCEDLYPLDFDRAFKKLDTIRDDLLFFDTAAKGIQFLAQKSVRMAVVSHGRIQQAKQQGLPLDFVWNQSGPSAIFFGVPKDAPHAKAAFALLDFMARPNIQADFARLTGYGVTTSAAADGLSADAAKALPSTHSAESCERDPVALSKEIDEYFKRFAEWSAKG